MATKEHGGIQAKNGTETKRNETNSQGPTRTLRDKGSDGKQQTSEILAQLLRMVATC